MKISLTALLAFLVLAVRAVAAPMDPIDPAKYSAPVRVACVGDSITQGVGAPPGKSYPSQLQALLGDKWLVKNFGVGGRTLLKKGIAPYWKEKAFQDAQDFQPDVVIIMLGTNDTKPQHWVDKADFIPNYTELVKIFQNLASKPRVYICHPPPVPAPGNYGITEENLDIEISWIDEVATEEKVGLIDMHSPFAGKDALFPDRVHPNDDGAAILAQTAAAALTAKATMP